jgi:hypothetical protein
MNSVRQIGDHLQTSMETGRVQGRGVANPSGRYGMTISRAWRGTQTSCVPPPGQRIRTRSGASGLCMTTTAESWDQ